MGIESMSIDALLNAAIRLAGSEAQLALLEALREKLRAVNTPPIARNIND